MVVRQNLPSCRDCALLVLGGVLAISATMARADEGASKKQQRLEFIRATLSRYEIESADQSGSSPTLSAEPVLWYTNPVRSATGTGALFFWLDGERPVAAISASIRDGGKVVRELSLLQERPLRVTRSGKVVWTPPALAKSQALVPEAPRPGRNPPMRLIQMRSIVRRFEANLLKEDMESAALRALSQPIYRYRDPAAGVLDGAVFALVEATDPEALLVLEATIDDAGGAWRYVVARMTSRPSEVLLDGHEVWNTKAYWRNPRSTEDPYSEAYDSQYEEQ